MSSIEGRDDRCMVDCQGGRRCPYVDGGDIWHLRAERDHLSQRMEEMEKLMEMGQAEIEKLRQEKEALQEKNKSLNYQLKQVLGKIFKPRVKPRHDGEQPKRGAPAGHRGNSRPRPEITSETEVIDIYPEKCEQCGGEVRGYTDIFDEHCEEDIEIKKKVTCRRYHRGYCQHCKKLVYPRKDEVPPRDRIGTGARALSGYMRHLGVTYRKVARFLKDVCDIHITHPSLLAFNAEQAQNAAPLYEGIKQSIQRSPSVNADETGWRNDGKNYWLWVFVNKEAVLYHIDESRGSKVVRGILGEKYEGVLSSDFYSAYNELDAAAKQRCLTHFLREIQKIQEKNEFPPGSVDEKFRSELKAALKETIDVWNRHREGTAGPEDLAETKDRAVLKMVELVSLPLEHEDTQRLRNRIMKYNQELFIFLDDPSVEPTNNRAERHLRPMVIMRKLTFGNRSDSRASNEAVLMSVVETGVLNHVEPLDIFRALSIKTLTSFGELPEPRPPP